MSSSNWNPILRGALPGRVLHPTWPWPGWEFSSIPVLAMARACCFFFVQANLTLAAFNLMPALPLDGGRILRACLTPRLGFRAATEQAALLGQILAGLLFAIGLAGLYYSYFNLSLPLIAVFLFVAATKEKQQAVYTFIRALGAKRAPAF